MMNSKIDNHNFLTIVVYDSLKRFKKPLFLKQKDAFNNKFPRGKVEGLMECEKYDF